MNETTHTMLGPGGEFDRIRSIWRVLGERGVGGGDDCALVRVGGAQLAVTCDQSIEDVHFRLGWLSPQEVGWRAAAAALSDVAAMAAAPEGVLASVAVPEEQPDSFAAELMGGVADAAESVGAKVWGGDLARSECVVVNVMVVGVVERPVRRKGARPGDGLWVTGRLGAPQAALAAWRAGKEPDGEARDRFVHPVPRVREAVWLAARGATAMIDVSDGIAGDAGHLAVASQVALSIDALSVPVHPAAAREDALAGGEEFELLVTMPGGFSDAEEFMRTFSLPLTRIGTVQSGTGVSGMEGFGGYSHF